MTVKTVCGHAPPLALTTAAPRSAHTGGAPRCNASTLVHHRASPSSSSRAESRVCSLLPRCKSVAQARAREAKPLSRLAFCFDFRATYILYESPKNRHFGRRQTQSLGALQCQGFDTKMYAAHTFSSAYKDQVKFKSKVFKD